MNPLPCSSGRPDASEVMIVTTDFRLLCAISEIACESFSVFFCVGDELREHPCSVRTRSKSARDPVRHFMFRGTFLIQLLVGERRTMVTRPKRSVKKNMSA